MRVASNLAAMPLFNIYLGVGVGEHAWLSTRWAQRLLVTYSGAVWGVHIVRIRDNLVDTESSRRLVSRNQPGRVDLENSRRS